MMKGTQILCLLFFSGFSSFTSGSSDFHFVNVAENYTDAKSYCRDKYTDLATVHNAADMDNLIASVPSNKDRAWIGLEIGDVWRWHWSSPDKGLDFFNWKAGEPQKSNQDICAAMNPGGEWFVSDCDTRQSFVCDGSNDTGHIFIAERKSWREAQNHCRNILSSDLVSIQSAEENEAVQKVSQSRTVWIGLFKDRWKWSDGSNSSFRYWKPNQPNYFRGNQDCVAAVIKDKGQWNDLRCDIKRKFVCHGARKSTATPATTKQTSTQQALVTVQMVTNQTVLPNSSSPEVITSTFQMTTVLPSTEQSNTVNVTTKQVITGSHPDQNVTSTFKPTTLNTTDLVSSLNSSTELSVTTETAPVTGTQHQTPTTTMQITTDDISASTPEGTSTYSTAESSTLMPSVHIQGLIPENLILIRENMTWNEAMSYCREHHVDLVYITAKEIHEWVAEKAKNATSSHVWLGLRYSCSFDFWFWIKSYAGCYQNWAPGQGPEGQYGCGITGAIEATGGQQWVGLPETEKLNFICYACAETGEEAQ
ncbi:uncharacterized protein LOC139914127 isoform X1 [Centroberyx gerrardi]